MGLFLADEVQEDERSFAGIGKGMAVAGAGDGDVAVMHNGLLAIAVGERAFARHDDINVLVVLVRP